MGDGRPGLVAWLAATPLAVWLGLTSLKPSASSPAPPVDRVVMQVPPVAPVSAATASHPSDFCLGRFVSPLEAIAGTETRQDTSPGAERKASLDIDGVTASVKLATPSHVSGDWLARVGDAAAEVRATFGIASDTPIETLIATVADPIDSGLDYQFESELGALALGVERRLASSGSNRDREWIPWDDRAIPEASRRESEACRATTPGIVLFRGSNPSEPKITVLLLVGESPATGLREAAMLNALSIGKVLERPERPSLRSEPEQRECRAGENATQPRSIRIVGPTFSGSAQSMRFALTRWANEHPGDLLSFEVITGSATGSGVPEILGKSGVRLSDSSAVSFKATTDSEGASECAYLWFLHEHFSVGSKPQSPELRGVATLRESGTEFGNAATNRGLEEQRRTDGERNGTPTSGCQWAPTTTLNFPFHISALRDAYEHLSAAPPEKGVARRTALPVSLREKHVPLDVEAEPSDKSKAALDLALANVLGQISRNDFRDVAIHATDIGDAIFLAQRIRDIAPDVRLAFFDADVLLAAQEYRRELLGSLVVTPYPFLGVHPFAYRPSEPLVGFENGTAEGVYNAVLAQRRSSVAGLSDYTFEAKEIPLPLWIATIGRNGLVPLSVAPTPDCEGNVYGAQFPPVKRRLCTKPSPEAWAAFNALQVADFSLESEARLPYLWDLAYFVLLLGFYIDFKRQERLARIFDASSGDDSVHGNDDRNLDRRMIRAKWRLYAAIRTLLFALLFSYMGFVYLLSCIARGGPLCSLDPKALYVLYVGFIFLTVFLSWGFALWRTYQAGKRYFDDFRELSQRIGGLWPWTPWVQNPFGDGGATVSSPEDDVEQHSWLDALSARVGTMDPCDRDSVVRTSFAQLRTLTVVTVLAGLWFTGWVVADAVASSGWRFTQHGRLAVPALVLSALRNTSLANGVSSSAAALLCMTCVYVWCVGRMARLTLAYRAAQQCPSDGVADLVSTPIRVILHPRTKARPGSRIAFNDDGFTAVERDVLNAIFRPITGPYYPLASAGLALFPFVLFTLKPLRTIEASAGTVLLESGLALCTFLVGVTLVQLVQYWFALEALLKRTMEHPLGPAFRTIAPFARDSIDHLVSRSTNDVLRLTAASRQFSDLAAASANEELSKLVSDRRDEIVEQASLLQRQRTAFLERRPVRSYGAVAATGVAESALGEQLIACASLVTKILESKWTQAHDVAIPLPDAPPMPVQQLAVGDIERSQTVLPTPPSFKRAALDSGFSPPSDSERDERPSSVRSSGPVAALATAPLRQAGAEQPIAPRGHDGPAGRGAGDNEPAADDAFASLAFRYGKAELAWLRAAESFVATVVTLLVHRHVRQFRYFLYVLTAGALLLLFAVSNYPFEPYRLLLTFTWIVLGSVVGVCLWVYIELERNTLLSHTAGTTPNSVTLDSSFVLRILTWGVLPLLSIAATQYPEFANFLYNLLSPFSRALH